jgi:hypothetical protein
MFSPRFLHYDVINCVDLIAALCNSEPIAPFTMVRTRYCHQPFSCTIVRSHRLPKDNSRLYFIFNIRLQMSRPSASFDESAFPEVLLSMQNSRLGILQNTFKIPFLSNCFLGHSI